MNPIEDFERSEQALFRMADAKRIPLNGSIEVTHLCTMDCDMCYVRLSREEMEARGRLRTAEEWLSVAQEMRDAGVLFLLLTGGEPLLYPGFRELYLGLRKMGFILMLNTNGTLLDEEWADFFAQNPPRRVNVTLYGASDKAYRELCHLPGGYARTVRAIELLRQRGVHVKLSYTMTVKNAEDLSAFLDYCKERDLVYGIDPRIMPATRERSRGFDFSSRLPAEEAAQTAHEIHRRYYPEREDFLAYCARQIAEVDARARFAEEHPEARKPERNTCKAGRCSFTLNWQGHMRPCVILRSPEADVFALGFAAAWRQIQDGMEALLIHADCAVCPRRGLCDICPASALYETGRQDGKPDYACRYTLELERLMREELAAADGECAQEDSPGL